MQGNPQNSTLDQALFEQLFKKHFGHLVNFAVQYVGDQDTAQDITQKVFIRLWESREKINANQNIPSYLFTSVKNRCLNHIRDHKKYRSQVLDLDAGDFDQPVEESLDMEALKIKIKKALEELPEKCRLVFEMSRYQHMKYKEIAEELEVSQKTVEAHMSKALKILRSRLGGWLLMEIILLSLFLASID